jgi:hypothetical protein
MADEVIARARRFVLGVSSSADRGSFDLDH